MTTDVDRQGGNIINDMLALLDKAMEAQQGQEQDVFSDKIGPDVLKDKSLQGKAQQFITFIDKIYEQLTALDANSGLGLGTTEIFFNETYATNVPQVHAVAGWQSYDFFIFVIDKRQLLVFPKVIADDAVMVDADDMGNVATLPNDSAIQYAVEGGDFTLYISYSSPDQLVLRLDSSGTELPVRFTGIRLPGGQGLPGPPGESGDAQRGAQGLRGLPGIKGLPGLDGDDGLFYYPWSFALDYDYRVDNEMPIDNGQWATVPANVPLDQITQLLFNSEDRAGVNQNHFLDTPEIGDGASIAIFQEDNAGDKHIYGYRITAAPDVTRGDPLYQAERLSDNTDNLIGPLAEQYESNALITVGDDTFLILAGNRLLEAGSVELTPFLEIRNLNDPEQATRRINFTIADELLSITTYNDQILAFYRTAGNSSFSIISYGTDAESATDFTRLAAPNSNFRRIFSSAVHDGDIYIYTSAVGPPDTANIYRVTLPDDPTQPYTTTFILAASLFTEAASRVVGLASYQGNLVGVRNTGQVYRLDVIAGTTELLFSTTFAASDSFINLTSATGQGDELYITTRSRIYRITPIPAPAERFRFHVERAADLDEGMMNDAIEGFTTNPARNAELRIKLLLPYVLTENAGFHERSSGFFQRFVGPAAALVISGLQENDTWPDILVSEANLATPGSNQIRDVVTLYRGGYTTTRSWNGVRWIPITNFLDGNLLVSGTVTTNAVATRTLVAENVALRTLRGENIEFQTLRGENFVARTITGEHVDFGTAEVFDYIQSEGYTPGPRGSGFRLSADGTAELDAASIRGVLQAGQISGDVQNFRTWYTGPIRVIGNVQSVTTQEGFEFFLLGSRGLPEAIIDSQILSNEGLFFKIGAIITVDLAFSASTFNLPQNTAFIGLNQLAAITEPSTARPIVITLDNNIVLGAAFQLSDEPFSIIPTFLTARLEGVNPLNTEEEGSFFMDALGGTPNSMYIHDDILYVPGVANNGFSFPDTTIPHIFSGIYAFNIAGRLYSSEHTFRHVLASRNRTVGGVGRIAVSDDRFYCLNQERVNANVTFFIDVYSRSLLGRVPDEDIMVGGFERYIGFSADEDNVYLIHLEDDRTVHVVPYDKSTKMPAAPIVFTSASITLPLFTQDMSSPTPEEPNVTATYVNGQLTLLIRQNENSAVPGQFASNRIVAFYSPTTPGFVELGQVRYDRSSRFAITQGSSGKLYIFINGTLRSYNRSNLTQNTGEAIANPAWTLTPRNQGLSLTGIGIRARAQNPRRNSELFGDVRVENIAIYRL